MRRRKTLIATALATLLVLSGCAGLGSSADSAEDSQAQYGFDDAPAAVSQSAVDGEAAASDQSGPVDVQRDSRAIIREGTIRIEVDNFSDSREAVRSEATERGGFVSESNEQLERNGDRTRRSGFVVVRVPTDEYESMQQAVSSEGIVVDERTETTDVSEELVDLNARIDNLEERRDRLRTFYERADDTQELLQIESELSEVQGEIERLEAQKRSLEQQVEYSTLRVEMTETEPSESVETRYHEQSLVGTFLDSVSTMYVLGRAMLVTGAALAPWLLPFAIPAGVLAWAFYRW